MSEQGNGCRWSRPRPRGPAGLVRPQVPWMKSPGSLSTPCAAMDATPGLLGTPPAEVLEEVLREQFGPLPQLAAICRLKRLPSGAYSSTDDLQLVLERRRVANAKERERVSALPRVGPQGHPVRQHQDPRAWTGMNSCPLLL